MSDAVQRGMQWARHQQIGPSIIRVGHVVNLEGPLEVHPLCLQAHQCCRARTERFLAHNVRCQVQDGNVRLDALQGDSGQRHRASEKTATHPRPSARRLWNNEAPCNTHLVVPSPTS